MNKDKIIIGIDTSNYTTSVSLISLDGEVIANVKRPLPVKEGERGLRQSEAVFAHIKNLPSAMGEVREVLAGRVPVAVGVSERPRNLDGSYMPCFLAGVSAAESISATLNIPLYKYSHQCGHVMAAIHSSGASDLLSGEDFVAFHVSGGTTEMLKVRAVDSGFSSELIGGTQDLNAGQVIDRIGVLMGLPFPCGVHMEKLALENREKIPSRKPKLQGLEVSLSGLENMAAKLYKDTDDKKLTSAFVFDYIGKALFSLAEKYEEEFGKTKFLFAGGVMSNSVIKNMLSKKFSARFAEPALSSDNAVGIAILASRTLNKG
jgi:N6-L-threonylcarbamoyladenine synthase